MGETILLYGGSLDNRSMKGSHGYSKNSSTPVNTQGNLVNKVFFFSNVGLECIHPD